MNKAAKIAITLIYTCFIIIFLSDLYEFLSVKGEGYPQLGRTHTFNGYVFEAVAFTVYSFVGIVLLWYNKCNKKMILIPYFIVFIASILILMYKNYNYW